MIENNSSILLSSRIRGAMFGGAIGDALGAPVEFWSYQRILDTHGSAGVTGFGRAYGGFARVTDDTQMALATLDGLISNWVQELRGGSTQGRQSAVARAYLCWLQGQGYAQSGETGWLYQNVLMQQQRAPGNTCINGLQWLRDFGYPPINDGAGCGAVMRMAPVGLEAALRPDMGDEACFADGVGFARLSHGGARGVYPAGAIALIVRELCRGTSMVEAAVVARAHLARTSEAAASVEAIDKALALATAPTPTVDAIRCIGEGWVGDEALAIGLLCALRAKDIRHGLLLAVNHDGDSDSTGSIAGNLLGALAGFDEIPADWRQEVEGSDLLATIVEDLLLCAAIQEGRCDRAELEELFTRYCPAPPRT